MLQLSIRTSLIPSSFILRGQSKPACIVSVAELCHQYHTSRPMAEVFLDQGSSFRKVDSKPERTSSSINLVGEYRNRVLSKYTGANSRETRLNFLEGPLRSDAAVLSDVLLYSQLERSVERSPFHRDACMVPVQQLDMRM